jgi:hypothetical protein
VNIFNTDLEKKLYAPLMRKINRVSNAHNYKTIYLYLKDFMSDMIKLPYNTPKSKVWIDTFKGEGAYYTLKNLAMYHNCYIEVPCKREVGYATNSMGYLQWALDAYKGEGWRMFALMKKVIKDNGINTKTHITEVCNK